LASSSKLLVYAGADWRQGSGWGPLGPALVDGPDSDTDMDDVGGGLAPELVDLRLQRGHSGLEFREFDHSFLAGSTGLVSRLGDK